jgi:hypothetical protein
MKLGETIHFGMTPRRETKTLRQQLDIPGFNQHALTGRNESAEELECGVVSMLCHVISGIQWYHSHRLKSE